MKVKEESESWLKTQHSKNKSWHPVPPVHEDKWGTMETVRDCNFGGSKITADGDCSHEIKRRLLLGRKAMANLDGILKSRDVTLLTKSHMST